jgi:lipopolysaccharide export LptBFGC system permease protein LptF
MGHYRMKKQQFDMAQRDIDQEKKKLASIVAEKQAWEKWDNSTPRVMEKTVKELEQMGKDFDREFGTTAPQPEQQPPPQEQPQQQQQEQQQPEDLSEPLSPFDVAATGIISEPPVELLVLKNPHLNNNNQSYYNYRSTFIRRAAKLLRIAIVFHNDEPILRKASINGSTIGSF